MSCCVLDHAFMDWSTSKELDMSCDHHRFMKTHWCWMFVEDRWEDYAMNTTRAYLFALKTDYHWWIFMPSFSCVETPLNDICCCVKECLQTTLKCIFRAFFKSVEVKLWCCITCDRWEYKNPKFTLGICMNFEVKYFHVYASCMSSCLLLRRVHEWLTVDVWLMMWRLLRRWWLPWNKHCFHYSMCEWPLLVEFNINAESYGRWELRIQCCNCLLGIYKTYFFALALRVEFNLRSL